MTNIKSTTRMALSIGIGCATLVWICASLGLVPNPKVAMAEKRILTTRGLAINAASYAENKGQKNLKTVFQRAVQTNDSLKSIGIKRKNSHQYVLTYGAHGSEWKSGEENDAEKQIAVDILSNGRKWGVLQVSFHPFERFGGRWGLGFPLGPILFVFAGATLFAWLILGRSLKYLNPSKVVPNRVRSALDTLTEGLVLIDKSGEIAHANAAFLEISKVDEKDILGKKLCEFGWIHNNTEFDDPCMPWQLCLESESRITGQFLNLDNGAKEVRKFAVNATPIFNGEDTVRGALISFDDVTALESKNAELAEIIGTLRSSRDEVARQNERLNFLASYDPLTQCMNRRAFFGEFEKYWADPEQKSLNLIILDVDHFKSVNDTHGHSVGDEVLKAMGNLLQTHVGDKGLVCRYGGEEFVVLVPNVKVEQCVALAEKLRIVIEQTSVCNINFTASFGVSSKEFIPMDPQHLLDQADESLYTAKRGGRNQVVRFDERQNYPDLEAADGVAVGENRKELIEGEVPYSAVSGLLSALSFRCPRTAEHSIRVADLCVAVGTKLMNRRELYRLEVAALLHDIGKVGVPDSILHKPGPLTPDEWKVMNKHDDIGGEIVRNAFGSDEIANWIESHHICFKKGKTDTVETELDSEIPLASRIITVCDAYDAMTNDRVYRAALPIEIALGELEKNAPMQFDPEVVEILTAYVRAGFHHPTPHERPEFSSKQASVIGQRIESLYDAIAEEDVGRLQDVVQQLREDTSQESRVTDVADRLDSAIGTSTEDIDEVLRLAGEVMQICRESRRTFVEAAESIVMVDE